MPSMQKPVGLNYPPSLKRKMATVPVAGDGLHRYLLDVVQQLRHYEPDVNAAGDMLFNLAIRGGRDEKAAVAEIQRLLSGYGETSSPTATPPQQQEPLPKPDLERIRETVLKSKLTLRGVEAESIKPNLPDNEMADHVVDTLLPDQIICVGRERHTAFCGTSAEIRDQLGSLNTFAFLVPNPMRERGVWVPGSPSPRCDKNVLRRSYVVIEWDMRPATDNGTPTMWKPLLDEWESKGISLMDAQVLLAVALEFTTSLRSVLTVHSGGKSLHNWFACEGRSSEAVDKFTRTAIALGADAACRTRCQYFRMPGGTREDGTHQRIVWMNSEEFNN